MTIADILADMLKHTLIAIRFTPPDNMVGRILWGCVNTAIRLTAMWLTIVVACHAVRFGIL